MNVSRGLNNLCAVVREQLGCTVSPGGSQKRNIHAVTSREQVISLSLSAEEVAPITLMCY